MKESQNTVQDIRAFNRFYTDFIGLLDGYLLSSPYSLAEGRILYEVHMGGYVSASQIMSVLTIDKGYLSRILKKLEKEELLSKKLSDRDGRIYLISLTEKGSKLFNELNAASNHQIDLLIKTLTAEKQHQLVHYMNAIVSILKK